MLWVRKESSGLRRLAAEDKNCHLWVNSLKAVFSHSGKIVDSLIGRISLPCGYEEESSFKPIVVYIIIGLLNKIDSIVEWIRWVNKARLLDL